jgi:hypothetical protein
VTQWNHPREEASLEEEQVTSFLVRVWREPGPQGPQFRGWVQHVQSGQRAYFHGIEGLSRVLADYLGVSRAERAGILSRRLRDRIAAWFGRQEKQG